MEVLLLTTLFSVVFAIFFLVLFIRDRQTRRFGGIEREALLPLEDDLADQAGAEDSKNFNKTAKLENPDIPTDEAGV